MNNYEEFNSKKSLIIILVICVLFLVLIIKAYTYLPDSSENSRIAAQNNIEQTESSFQSSDEDAAESQEENDNKQEENSKNLKVSLPAPDKITEIEDQSEATKVENELSSIETELPNTEEKQQELSPEEQAEQILIQGDKYKKDKQYVKALEEYNKISSITKDTYYVAKSYEEIATIYAIVKRYGTALSFAQKAYNMSPTSSREMLLARLYYKTGDIDKATQRINNVLRRDFAADR